MDSCGICGHIISVSKRFLSVKKTSVVATFRKLAIQHCCNSYLSDYSLKANMCNLSKFDARKLTTISSNSSVLEEETTKFSSFAKNWWELHGDMKALHSMNRIRVPFIRDNLIMQGHGRPDTSKPLGGISILDVGCGAGILSEPLARLGASVVGIDSSDAVLTSAKIHREFDSELGSLQYLDSWLEDIVAVGTLKFDCVVASEVLEHVNDPREFVKMCATILKPDGSLFYSTINRTELSYLYTIVLAEYLFGIVPKGTHEWNKFLTPDELSYHLKESGCCIRKILGMNYNPIINKWSWSDHKECNYILHATKY